jgi:hypothetical protein
MYFQKMSSWVNIKSGAQCLKLSWKNKKQLNKKTEEVESEITSETQFEANL